MKNGYEKFFKDARKSAAKSSPPAQRMKFQRGGTPEDRLREELAERMTRRKKQRALARKKSFPLYPVLCVAAALGLTAAGYYNSDRLDQWMSKIEISMLGHASASEPAAKPAANPAKSAAPT